jgi:hypothetical protein
LGELDNEVTSHHRREPTNEEKAKGQNAASDFFERLRRLTDLGLVQWVPHVFESDDADAEAIHPYYPDGEAMERDLAGACQAAAESLLREDQISNAYGMHLVPIKRHVGRVQMVSIGRLRYRPRTAPTSAWWAAMVQTCLAHQKAYEALARGQESPFSQANQPTSARTA